MFILEEVPIIEIDRSLLIQILKRENEIRMSPEIQDQYTNMRINYKADGEEEYDLFRIDRQAQLMALRDFGFEPSEDDSLEAYQLSCGLWMDEEEVKECVVWMKYEFMKLGTLEIGDLAPEANLFNLEGKSISLSSHYNAERPLIVVGGSYS